MFPEGIIFMLFATPPLDDTVVLPPTPDADYLLL